MLAHEHYFLQVLHFPKICDVKQLRQGSFIAIQDRNENEILFIQLLRSTVFAEVTFVAHEDRLEKVVEKFVVF